MKYPQNCPVRLYIIECTIRGLTIILVWKETLCQKIIQLEIFKNFKIVLNFLNFQNIIFIIFDINFSKNVNIFNS